MRAKVVENFRALVLVALVARAASWFLSYQAAELSPEGSEAVAEWVGYGASIDGDSLTAFWYGCLAAESAALAGSFFFLRPARWLLLFVMCVSPVLLAVSGIAVLTPIENVANSIYQIVFTFVVGMAFFSTPVAARFAGSTDESVVTGRP